MEIKGIKYIAPFFDNSGYGKASRGNIFALHKQGVPLTLKPVSFETVRPDLGNDGKILDELLNKDIDYNIVIVHTTPEFWMKHVENSKTNLGYTIWETSKVHPAWPIYMNIDSIAKVLVGCGWNKEVFTQSGVEKPIGVVPHGINMDSFDDVKPFHISGVKDDAYVFYNIFQWCYDEKTRVLTRDGFKYFKELSYDDEVATLNLKTEELEYQKPEKIVRFRRRDKMISIKGSLFDVCVTPDHKMVVREKSESNWGLTPLNKLISKGKSNQIILPEKYRAKKNCKWLKGKEKSVFKIPTLSDNKYPVRKHTTTEISMDVFLEFMGWYLSEGSTYAAKRGYVNTITQVKEKYIPEIIDCIKKMGFNPFKKKKDIIFHSREMHHYLKQFGKSKDKFIPVWIKDLSPRQLKILLDSLFKGDGSLYKNGDWVKYTTTSKRLAEDIQECLLKTGLSGAISIEDPLLKTPGKIGDRYIRGKLLQYVVSVNRDRNEPSMYYAKLQEIDYDGFVYCATVPNHTMLVERNGKVIFSGNTERKNPLALIKAYWHEFKEKDNVALVLKTYRSSYDESEKEAIRTTIKRLKMVSPTDYYPSIYLIPNMLSEAEILGLHARGDCYVSLDRGEGFGLSHFTSGAAGNPLITTGYGGVKEYANDSNSYLSDYHLSPVFGMPFSPWYRLDQLWAEPSVKHGADLMRYVYENQDESKARGQKLKKDISENFTWEIIGKKIIEEIEQI
jgi:glycosyltransferase involved in cell wall biosynthesis